MSRLCHEAISTQVAQPLYMSLTFTSTWHLARGQETCQVRSLSCQHWPDSGRAGAYGVGMGR